MELKLRFKRENRKFIHGVHFYFPVLISLQDFQLWPGGPNFSQHQRVRLKKAYQMIRYQISFFFFLIKRLIFYLVSLVHEYFRSLLFMNINFAPFTTGHDDENLESHIIQYL